MSAVVVVCSADDDDEMTSDTDAAGTPSATKSVDIAYEVTKITINTIRGYGHAY